MDGGVELPSARVYWGLFYYYWLIRAVISWLMFFYSEVQLGKLFFWIGVVVVLMVILRIISYSKHRQQVQQARNLSLSRGKEPMVRCSHCGIYLPRSEALMSNQHTWCSLEHAKLGVRN